MSIGSDPEVQARQETLRQAAVFASGLLAMRSDPTLFALVGRMAAEFAVPMAGITVIDRGRCWLPITVGSDLDSVVLDEAICPHVVAKAQPLCVADLATHPQLSAHWAVVGPYRVKAYAGVPMLGVNGSALGTVYIADVVRREDFDDTTIARLEKISTQVMKHANQPRHLRRIGPFVVDLLMPMIRAAARDDDHDLVDALDDILRGVEQGSGLG